MKNRRTNFVNCVAMIKDKLNGLSNYTFLNPTNNLIKSIFDGFVRVSAWQGFLISNVNWNQILKIAESFTKLFQVLKQRLSTKMLRRFPPVRFNSNTSFSQFYLQPSPFPTKLRWSTIWISEKVKIKFGKLDFSFLSCFALQIAQLAIKSNKFPLKQLARRHVRHP